MFFKKKKKRRSGVKKKQKINLKEFFTAPIIILSSITFILISSFVYQLNKEDNGILNPRLISARLSTGFRISGQKWTKDSKVLCKKG